MYNLAIYLFLLNASYDQCQNNNIVVTDPNNNYEPTPDVSETQNNDVTENNQGEIPDETHQKKIIEIFRKGY